MRPALLLMALLAAISVTATARETLTVPAVSVELLFGGEGKVTVDGKATKLSGEQATKLKADLAALHVDDMRRDLSRLQDLEAAAARASKEAVTRGRAVEREQDRVADQQKLIATLEKRQGFKVACPEEIAWRNGWIDDEQLLALAKPLEKSGYGRYLTNLLQDR